MYASDAAHDVGIYSMTPPIKNIANVETSMIFLDLIVINYY